MTESARIVDAMKLQAQRDEAVMPTRDPAKEASGAGPPLPASRPEPPDDDQYHTLCRDKRNLGDLLMLVIRWKWDETAVGKSVKEYLNARLAQVTQAENATKFCDGLLTWLAQSETYQRRLNNGKRHNDGNGTSDGHSRDDEAGE